MALNPLGFLGPFIIKKEKRMMTPAEVQEVATLIPLVGISVSTVSVVVTSLPSLSVVVTVVVVVSNTLPEAAKNLSAPKVTTN